MTQINATFEISGDDGYLASKRVTGSLEGLRGSALMEHEKIGLEFEVG
jgi:hypothetical protein